MNCLYQQSGYHTYSSHLYTCHLSHQEHPVQTPCFCLRGGKRKYSVGALRIELAKSEMKLLWFFLLTLTFLLAHRNVATAEDVTVAKCRYEDDLGNKWDFNGIASPGLPQACEPDTCTTTTASGKVVSANLCEPLSGDKLGVCKEVSGEQVMAFAKFKAAENSCIKFGVVSPSSSPSVFKVDINQLDITYSGQPCSYSPTRKFSITYSFHCDNKVTATTYALASSDKCSYNLHIYSQKACPDLAAKALSPFVVLLLILAGIFTLYCLAGVLYNSQVRGTSGIESIPNVDFWRNFLKYVEDGFLYCYLTLTCQERTIMHESLMQDDQLSNPNFDDNADIKDGAPNENIVTHL